MRHIMKAQYLLAAILVTIILFNCCDGCKTKKNRRKQIPAKVIPSQAIPSKVIPSEEIPSKAIPLETTTEYMDQYIEDELLKHRCGFNESALLAQKLCVDTKLVNWCLNSCKNNYDIYTWMRCELNNNTEWLGLYRCNETNYFNQSNSMFYLNFTQNSSLDELLTHLNTETSTLTELDIASAADILETTSQLAPKITYTKPFFNVINNLLDVNQSVLKTSRDFGSTDRIIRSIDNFVVGLSQEITSYSLNLSNIAIEITNPTSSKHDDDHFKVNFNKIDVKIPTEILNTCSLTTYKSNHLFLEGNVVSDIVDLKVLGVKENLNNSISLYLPVNSKDVVVCSFWEFNEKNVGNWSKNGVETIRLSDTLVECKTNHLTAFVLLGVSDTIIENLSKSNQLALEIISTILCSFSLTGLIMIFTTSLVLKKWYSRRINTIQISGVIALEIILIFLNDITTIKNDLGCKIFGIFMHYLVLVKFILMLLIARMQYENFVTVLTSRSRSRNLLLNALITFSIPILIVGISAGVFPGDYNSGNVNFCYPKDAAFRYFLVIPIAFILIINIIIFVMVMFHISNSISRKNKQKILQIKLCIMLFFMLGLTWIFSVLSHAVATPSLQIILIYIFSILSPLQGFVIFVFAIIFDADAKSFWLNCCKKFKYKAVDTESSKHTMSSTVLMSSVDLN